jgi:small subunit ribosomal protein S16
MSVKLRFKRMGRSNRPFFRLNVMDSRSPRDGRVIEELGFYDPRATEHDKQFIVKLDRCKHWLDVGAIPSETVSTMLKRSGLTHKMLRLPRPGKPRPAPVDPKVAAEAKAAKDAAKAAAAKEAAEKPAEPKAEEKA